jgi:DNA-binding transcriptional LysR family regulator
MDIDGLLIFVRVVQAGGFSKASRLLKIPKSTVSRKVAELEASLGVPLLHRTTRSLRITDIGSAYFEHGLKIANEVEKADALLTNLQSIPQGVLKLTAPVEFGAFLGKTVDAFLKANRKVSVELMLTERVVDLIAEGFDLAIRIGDLKDSSLIARKIGTLDQQLYASPRYLREHGRPSICTDLKEHECILFTAEEDRPKWHLRGPKGAMTVAVSGRTSSNNMAMIRELALRDRGIALMPSFFCAEDVKSGNLEPVLKDWVDIAGPIHAVFPGQRFLLPKVRAFIEHIAQEWGSERRSK